MISIIAHRGFWLHESEQNTLVAFERALSGGFGIETDLRDHNKEVVISHDMPHEGSMKIEDFLKICSRYDDKLILALNIKSDGLQQELRNSDIANTHFYFDMSVPDMLTYLKYSMVLYSRYSEIETTPSLYEKTEGIWLDNFADGKLNIVALNRFLQDGKRVVLVSPELHKRNSSKYWIALKDFLDENPQYSELIGLCTDFPSKAREFFYE